MNLKNTLNIIILIALTTSLFSSCKSPTSNVDLKDFSIRDTANVYRFTITTNNADSITLSRMNENKVWMIENPNYKANMSNINLIMETFYRIQIKQPVSKNAEKNVTCVKRWASAKSPNPILLPLGLAFNTDLHTSWTYLLPGLT